MVFLYAYTIGYYRLSFHKPVQGSWMVQPDVIIVNLRNQQKKNGS